MKITNHSGRRLILSLIALVVFFVTLPGQENILQQRISLELSDNTIIEAIGMIEQTSDARFAYSSNFIPPTRHSFHFKNKTIKKILDKLLTGTRLNYISQNDHIVIFPPKEEEITEGPPPPPRFTISGYIRDVATGEELIGSTVLVEQLAKGNSSNAYGFYSLTLPQGKYSLVFSHLGYEEQQKAVDLNHNQKIDFSLKPAVHELQQVIVSAKVAEDRIVLDKMGSTTMDINDINQIPALFGAQDIMQSLQLLPGVSATGEASGSFSVRGGNSDHNLILLDEAPIYNASHLLGIYSVFNTDALKNAKLVKGATPTEYRGRLASVVDIRMKEGNTQKFAVSGGIGMIASRLKLEGKILKDKSSFLIAGRRTYQDIIIKLITGDISNKNAAFFSDLNAKVNYRFNNKDRLFLSGYFGSDVFRVNEQNEVSWGNKTGTLRWNHLFNDRLFLNTSVIYNKYNFLSFTNLEETIDNEGQINSSIQTQIKDFHVKGNFQYYPNPESSWKFGWGLIHHTFIPAKVINVTEGKVRREVPAKPALELSVYAVNKWQLNKRLRIDYGIHFSNFSVFGSGDFIYDYDQKGMRIDSAYFGKGQLVKNYSGLEPRFSLNYLLSDQQSIKFSYGHNYQYMQRLSSAFANNPANVWLPSSKIIRPQVADQLAFGYFRTMANGKLEASVEAFYKNMRHQIDYRDGALLGFAPRDIESLLVFGKVQAMGAEFLFRKKSGRFRGWVAYTFSSSRGKFDEIANGQTFPSDVDRTHDFSLIGIFDINKKCTLAAKWIYFTGKAVTLPNGKYEIDGHVLDFYSRRNSYRLDNTHRLDVSLTLYRKGNRARGSSWNFAIYNFYARKNPSIVYIDNNNSSKSDVFEISLFSFIPSVTYSFKI